MQLTRVEHIFEYDICTVLRAHRTSLQERETALHHWKKAYCQLLLDDER